MLTLTRHKGTDNVCFWAKHFGIRWLWVLWHRTMTSWHATADTLRTVGFNQIGIAKWFTTHSRRQHVVGCPSFRWVFWACRHAQSGIWLPQSIYMYLLYPQTTSNNQYSLEGVPLLRYCTQPMTGILHLPETLSCHVLRHARLNFFMTYQGAPECQFGW